MMAFLIGVRFPSWWWVTGPLAAFLASAMALIPPTVIGPQIPRSTPISTLTSQEELLFALVWAIPDVAQFSILYALVAGAGVW